VWPILWNSFAKHRPEEEPTAVQGTYRIVTRDIQMQPLETILMLSAEQIAGARTPNKATVK